MFHSFYTISEMSLYSGIPAKTLRYYDEIGLLAPADRQGTGDYRLYTREQLEQSLLLRTLKTMDLSLKEIKTEFEQMNSKRYEELLRIRLHRISDEISELQREQRNMQQLLTDVEDALSSEKGKCLFRHYPATHGYFYKKRITNRMEMELALREVDAFYGNGKHVGRVMRMVSKENLLHGDPLIYDGVFIPQDSTPVVSDENRYTLAESDYLVFFESAPHETSGPIWKKICEFIQENKLTIKDDYAIRSIPVEMGISRRENDYVAKFFVPIRGM